MSRETSETQSTAGMRWLVAGLLSLGVAASAMSLAGLTDTVRANAHRRAGWAMSGMVVCESAPAAEVGRKILEDGGNAIDAAVATAFAQAVAFPWAGALGGGGFAVVHLAAGDDLSLDFREVAPRRAYRNMYLDESGEVVPGLSLYSHLASGVPGSVDGLLRLHADHGSGEISRQQLLRPAVALARGLTVDHDLAFRLNGKRERLDRQPAAREIFVRSDGRDWRPGDVLVQSDLAATLQRIAEGGRDEFYGGVTADSIVAEMTRGGGILDARDLRDYRSRYREPLRGTFRGYDLVTMGPPSSGGVLVIQLLNMLEHRDLDVLGWGSVDYIHLLTEAERRAYADRAQHLGDPDHWDVPLGMLLSKEYAAARMDGVRMDRATRSLDVAAGEVKGPDSGETTHLSVVDEAGNAVSMTITLNAGFGSGLVVGGTGILLNNEMDDFSAKPGVSNLYGLVGNEANAIAPGKKMLSSMSPTLVLRDGRVELVLGSPGGSRIITSVVQVILNTLVFEMPIAQAVAVPRVHAQWLPDKIFVEAFGLAPEVTDGLEAKGHIVEVFSKDGIGRVNAIARAEEGWLAGPDIRGQCVASGH